MSERQHPHKWPKTVASAFELAPPPPIRNGLENMNRTEEKTELVKFEIPIELLIHVIRKMPRNVSLELYLNHLIRTGMKSEGVL